MRTHFPRSRPHDRPRTFASCLTIARRISAFAVFAFAAACGGSSDAATGSGTNPPPTPREGSLAIAVTGLPASASPAITITGPNGFSRSISAPTTLSVAPGDYLVAATDISSGADHFSAVSASQSVTITASATSSVTVAYAIASGSLYIAASGLPDSARASIAVAGPAGFARTVTTPDTVRGLVPGTYTLTAGALVQNGSTWAPAASQIQLNVAASLTPLPASFPYALASGALVISSEGLPIGATASVTLSGPNEFSQKAAVGDTIRNLLAGTYTLTATSVAVGDDAYAPPAPVQIVVTPSLDARPASLRYSLSSGRLAVAVTGVPSGATASVAVSGPGGYTRTLTASETMTGLTPGDYTITAADFSTSLATYAAASATQHIIVTASTAAAQASVAYSQSSGALAIVVTGLPTTSSGAVTITGPNGFSTQITATATLTKLKPGSYTVAAATVSAGAGMYAATPATQTIAVPASPTAAPALVTYALASGSLALTVNGLPQGSNASITVTGPGGFSRNVTGTSLLLGITPGSYTIAAQSIQVNGNPWGPSPASQNVTVNASNLATNATVTYTNSTGTLNLNVSGLPVGTNAAITVTGPGGYSSARTGTGAITGLATGIYTVAAASVTASGTTYNASIASQNVMVNAGLTSNINVAYAAAPAPPPPPGPLNLTIDNMHVQQVVQNYAGNVPLVAGRDGLLRVFVKANGTNTAAPTVRLRFYNGASLTNTVTVNATASSVPTAITEGTLSSSWNYTIPAAVMQPGLRVLADVDPTNVVVESSDSDNSFPVSGTPLDLDIRAVPTFNLRLVPILQSVNSLQGGVTSANAAQYIANTRKIWPLGTVDVDVRAVYTTNAPVIMADDANGAWGQLLSEINALRTADGSTRNYYGIMRVNYFSGIAGLGYVPGRAAIGWDYLPSASEVMAHELGHNFGRFHAPCGGAGGPDPSYPYANGAIGVYGYDIASNTLKAPSTTDLMGYCSSPWVSDYNYKAVLNYRTSNPFSASAAFAGSYAQRGLLVWGRIEHGKTILEPAFEVNAPPSLPQRGGRNHLEAFNSLGARVLDLSFDGETVADLPDPTAQHFAFVVPLSSFGGAAPSRLRFTAAGHQSELSVGGASNETPVVKRIAANRVEITWRDASTRGVLVRDPRTGDILSFARNGRASVYTTSSELDLSLSGGVGSANKRVQVMR